MRWNKSDAASCYVLFLLAVLPTLFLRDFTPANELRYLSIAEEALRNHTFFTFTNHGVAYADKPPLYFWWVMLGKWMFGTHRMWFLSLASLVPALITVRTMDKWVEGEMPDTNRTIARMMLLTGGLFAGLAVTLRMDMLLCMFIVLALREFHRMTRPQENRNRSALLLGLYTFLAVFSKGMVGLLVPLCSSVVYLLWNGEIKTLFRYWGWRTWVLPLLGATLWLGAVYAEGGTEYLHNLVFHQTFDRAVNSFHHKAPFYYYAIAVWYSIAPWSLAVISIIGMAAVRRLPLFNLQRLFAATAGSTFVMLSCISSKLQVYLLPAFPFIIYLAAFHLQTMARERWLKIILSVTAGIFVCALPTIIIVANIGETAYLAHRLLFAAATVMTLAGLLALWRVFRKQSEVKDVVGTLFHGLLATLFIGGCALPAINPWIGYEALCQKTKEIANEKHTREISALELRRPENMDALMGLPVNELKEKDLGLLRTSHRTVVMLRRKYLKYFPDKKACIVGPNAVIYID